jgi:choline dehydrogenase-like flavoprotein
VVFVCATLGEVGENNPDNWIRPNGGPDPTTNITVQLQAGPREQHLWDVLDEATYQTIAALASRGAGALPSIEYWIEGGVPDQGFWQARRPGKQQIRLPIIVHEASALWIGEDPATSVVGLDYRPHGVRNVYVTGGGLFPTSGSWNPTLTMCGLAQDLAERLS